MSASDFTKSAARVSEGFCPLCGTSLTRIESQDRPPEALCESCAVTWWFDMSLGPDRPALRTSRALSKDEIQKLYSREGE